jgi:hypothetical protein
MELGVHCRPHNSPPLVTNQIQMTSVFFFYSKFTPILSSLLLLSLRSGRFTWAFPTRPSKHSPFPLCVLHAPVVSSRNLIYIMIVKVSYFSCFSFFIFPLGPNMCVSTEERPSGMWSSSQPCWADVLQLAALSDSPSVQRFSAHLIAVLPEATVLAWQHSMPDRLCLNSLLMSKLLCSDWRESCLVKLLG